MVAIIDYNLGNLHSVKKAFNKLNIESKITSNLDDIKNSSMIVLPGVGSFCQGMENLISLNLDKVIYEEVKINKKPFLGICLGMQLIASFGNEPHRCKGLDLIEGEVVKMNSSKFKIPHMGWNNVEAINSKYLNSQKKSDYYFIHSYHFVPKLNSVISGLVDYGEQYVASIEFQNIFATQFHPEKSQSEGLSLIQKFVSINVKN